MVITIELILKIKGKRYCEFLDYEENKHLLLLNANDYLNHEKGHFIIKSKGFDLKLKRFIVLTERIE
jgi:hypothetical protein